MRRGFTLIELIVVIIIMGLLAATALPRFVDLSEQVREGTAKGNLGAIRAAIAIKYSSNAAVHYTPLLPASIETDMFQENLIPEDPYSQSNAVQVGSTQPTGTAGGWYYNSIDGRIFLNHTLYSMY